MLKDSGMENYSYNPTIDKCGYKISVLVDTPDSWILPWTRKLATILSPYHEVYLCLNKNDIQYGDFAFILGCVNILSDQYLKRNIYNLVIHESDLPKGRGWSPVAWQILEGKNHIPVVMFDAVKDVDAGLIYLRDCIELDGTELSSCIRKKQGQKTIEMVLKFLELWPDIELTQQTGEPEYYPKRSITDDQLDINKSIADIFDHLRISDNEKYPAWFEYRGKKYDLKIYYKREDNLL